MAQFMGRFDNPSCDRHCQLDSLKKTITRYFSNQCLQHGAYMFKLYLISQNKSTVVVNLHEEGT